MQVYINGTIELPRALTSEERAAIQAEWGEQIVGVSKDGTAIMLYGDAPVGYADEAIIDIGEVLEEFGIAIPEGTSVSYAGDYDGALRKEFGEWVDYEATPIIYMPTEALEKELEYRRKLGI